MVQTPVEVKASNSASGVNVRLISTAEEMNQLRDMPEASFELANDIDMKDIDWKPVDFSGTLDGNGHRILNLKVTELGDKKRTTYDGNYKEYDTSFAGMFGCLENATIKNLNIVNLVVDIDEDKDVFVGGFAGYASKSTITDCTLTARLNMSVKSKMFGVGGAIGFGDGVLNNCTVDTVMVAIDKDDANRDESFLGGAQGAGHLDVVNCDIILDGYLSDAGYVHSGGLNGMYITARGDSYYGKITDNTVTGKITFYENNTDRRAYCEGEIGEIMTWNFERGRNDITGFTKDERFDYSKPLKPEMCEKPEYSRIYAAASPTEPGYAVYTCKECGYTYNDEYYLYNNVSAEATVDEKTESAESKDNVAEQAADVEQEADAVSETSNNNVFLRVLVGLFLALGLLITGLLVHAFVRRK